jgi:hypothetical protein
MKEPHLPASLDEIDQQYEVIKSTVEYQIHKAFCLGEDRQRVEFFEILRKLMLEKDMAGDEIAVEVLSWAYDRLAKES